MSQLEALVANSQLHWSDYLVLAIYFVIVIAVGIWSSCLNRGSVKGYFLAGGNMHWILVGASLFASNIGSGHFVGLAGSAAASGVGISIFELSAVFILMLLGWVFVPVYISAGVFTMPEYLKTRFGGSRIRVYLAVLAVLLYVFTKISADLFAGAIFIKQSIGWNIWPSVIALLVLSMLFTVGGGLSAVIWTDFVQVLIMVIGAFVLMAISFMDPKVGGYQGIKDKFLSPAAWPNITRVYDSMMNQNDSSGNMTDEMRMYANCGKTPENSFHLMRAVTDPSLPWTGVVFGLTISSVWYWCSDQVIVQRALAAKNMIHVKAGVVLAGCLKMLPLFIMVFPGMISRLLFPELVGCATPESCKEICDNKAGCTNIAYPLLVVKLLPAGARGLMLAVMMSALMSSLTSIFNSSSTIFTLDIWRQFRKAATETELMIVGRVFVVIIVAISIAWIPIIQNISELFHYIQGITSFLAPPVCAVYVLAISWKRINEHGAFWGLMVGLAVGLVRFVWEFSYGPAPPCGETDTRPAIITKVHYLHFGCILFAIVCIVTISISLLTKPIHEKHLKRLTYCSRFEEGERVPIEGRGRENDSKSTIASNRSVGASEEDEEALNGSTLPLKEKKDRDENEYMDVEEDVTEDVTVEDKSPCYKRALYWICGIERLRNSSSKQENISSVNMSIDENPCHSTIVNILAMTLMIATAFVWGFYA
ncbi:SLC5A9 [Bugula neritina]|uniref:SLC5A9 n=1 Tax=Bugula neritina TaxID=10212 RepID=A0A7J7IZL5_BUGNE|nr:SLC5A9 [Bugula neritina]